MLLTAGAAFWLGVMVAAGGGNAFGRAVVSAIVVLTLAALPSLPFPTGRATGETVVRVLRGVEVTLIVLTFFSPLIFGWIPVVLTILAITWWPRLPAGPALTPFHLRAQILAFLSVLAPFALPA